nr:50S ribosomal protein L44e [Candidatus Sigynarchaeota archaeon]
MRDPREQMSYCPKCGKHTLHQASIYKKGKERKIIAQGWRRYNRKMQGYGSQPKPIFRRNAKINKRVLTILTCKTCQRKIHGGAVRLKKFELV